MRPVIRSLLLDGVWTPGSIPNIIEWHDWQTQPGSNGDAIASTVGLIRGLPMVQAVGTAKPTIDDAAINGHRGASVTTDDFMTCDALAAYLSGDDIAFTVFGVVQASDAASVNQYMLSVGASGNTTQFHALLKRAVSAGSTFQVLRKTLNAIGALLPATPFAFVQVFTGTTVTVYTGQSLTKSIDTAALDEATMPVNQYTIGVLRRSSNSSYMTGKWGEHILVAGAVTDISTIQNFMNYAARRWGTP